MNYPKFKKWFKSPEEVQGIYEDALSYAHGAGGGKWLGMTEETWAVFNERGMEGCISRPQARTVSGFSYNYRRNRGMPLDDHAFERFLREEGQGSAPLTFVMKRPTPQPEQDDEHPNVVPFRHRDGDDPKG